MQSSDLPQSFTSLPALKLFNDVSESLGVSLLLWMPVWCRNCVQDGRFCLILLSFVRNRAVFGALTLGVISRSATRIGRFLEPADEATTPQSRGDVTNFGAVSN